MRSPKAGRFSDALHRHMPWIGYIKSQDDFEQARRMIVGRGFRPESVLFEVIRKFRLDDSMVSSIKQFNYIPIPFQDARNLYYIKENGSPLTNRLERSRLPMTLMKAITTAVAQCKFTQKIDRPAWADFLKIQSTIYDQLLVIFGGALVSLSVPNRDRSGSGLITIDKVIYALATGTMIFMTVRPGISENTIKGLVATNCDLLDFRNNFNAKYNWAVITAVVTDIGEWRNEIFKYDSKNRTLTRIARFKILGPWTHNPDDLIEIRRCK